LKRLVSVLVDLELEDGRLGLQDSGLRLGLGPSWTWHKPGVWWNLAAKSSSLLSTRQVL